MIQGGKRAQLIIQGGKGVQLLIIHGGKGVTIIKFKGERGAQLMIQGGQGACASNASLHNVLHNIFCVKKIKKSLHNYTCISTAHGEVIHCCVVTEMYILITTTPIPVT